MGENSNENLNGLHDLLHQIQNVDLPGTDTPNPDEGGADEAKDQANENAVEYMNSKDEFATEYMPDRSNATEFDYKDYGRYINQSLSTYSIPCPYTGPIDFEFKEKSSKVKVVNTLLDLLNQRQQSKEFILEAQDVIQDLQVQKRDKESRIQVLTKECQNQKKQIHASTSKLRNKTLELRKKEANLTGKLKKLNNEKKQLELRHKQLQTETRKKDKTIQALKAKIEKQMDSSEKRQRVTLGMRSLNDDLVLRRMQQKKGRSARSEEFQLLKTELNQAKERTDELSDENQNLRHDLMTLRLEVRQALLGEELGDNYDEPMDLDVSPHVFEMPYDMVQSQIRNDVKKDLNKYRKQEKQKREGYRNTDDTPGGELHQDLPANEDGGPIDHLGGGQYHPQQPGQPDDDLGGPDIGLEALGSVPELELDLNFAGGSGGPDDLGGGNYDMGGLDMGDDMYDLNNGLNEMKFD